MDAGESDGGFDGPDEGTEAETGFGLVEGPEVVEERVDAGVVDHGEHGLGQRGPGVGAQMGFAAMRAAPLHGAEGCVAAALTGVQDFDYMFVVGLVVGDEYGFHFCNFCFKSLR